MNRAGSWSWPSAWSRWTLCAAGPVPAAAAASSRRVRFAPAPTGPQPRRQGSSRWQQQWLLLLRRRRQRSSWRPASWPSPPAFSLPRAQQKTQTTAAAVVAAGQTRQACQLAGAADAGDGCRDQGPHGLVGKKHIYVAYKYHHRHWAPKTVRLSAVQVFLPQIRRHWNAVYAAISADETVLLAGSFGYFNCSQSLGKISCEFSSATVGMLPTIFSVAYDLHTLHQILSHSLKSNKKHSDGKAHSLTYQKFMKLISCFTQGMSLRFEKIATENQVK